VIVASVLLILVAIVLLGFGLTGGSDAPLFGSIGASLLAAVALYVGARQSAAARAADLDEYEQYDESLIPARGDRGKRAAAREPVYAGVGARGSAVAPAVGTAIVDVLTEPTRAQTELIVDPLSGAPPIEIIPAPSIPSQTSYPTLAELDEDEDDDEFVDEDPPDEPKAQSVLPADAARVAQMSDDVLVVDGRPRYHLADCEHLVRRECEALSVSEAVELGFTPCGLCEPVSALLAEARPV